MSHKKKLKELQDEQDAMWDKLSTPAIIWPPRHWIFDNDVASMYPHQNFVDGMVGDELEVYAATIGVPKTMLGKHDEEK